MQSGSPHLLGYFASAASLCCHPPNPAQWSQLKKGRGKKKAKQSLLGAASFSCRKDGLQGRCDAYETRAISIRAKKEEGEKKKNTHIIILPSLFSV